MPPNFSGLFCFPIMDFVPIPQNYGTKSGTAVKDPAGRISCFKVGLHSLMQNQCYCVVANAGHGGFGETQYSPSCSPSSVLQVLQSGMQV